MRRGSRPWTLAAAGILLITAPARSQEAKALPRHPRDILMPSLPPFAPPLPRRVELADGRQVFVMGDSLSPVLEGAVLYRAGTVDEPGGLVGVASLLADVMRTAGSVSHPNPELDAWLASRGAELTITVGLEAFEVRFACPPEAWGSVLERVASVLREPAITPESLQRARRRLVTEGAGRRADPLFLASWALSVVAYGADSPYARQPSPESLQAISVENLVAFHRARIRPAQPVIGILGEATDEQALALGAALSAAGGEPGTVDAMTRRDDEATSFAGFIQPARTRVWIVDRPHLMHTEVRIAAPGVRRLDPDASELELWSRIVGRGGRTQRMGARFPDRSVAAGFLPEWNRAGAFLGMFSTPNRDVGQTLRGMFEVLERSKATVSVEDVDRVRGRLMNEELIAADSPSEAFERFLDLEFHGYPEDFYRQRVLSWRNVDPEALAQAVEARLDLERMVIVAVGPIEELAGQLAPLGTVEELSLELALAPGANQPEVVEDMFEALGGRQAWADAAAVQAQIDIVLPDREMPSRQWSDLGGPRLRAEYLVASETVVLVVDEQRALQVTSQGRTQLDADTHRAQLEAKRRTLWEILHRMARSTGVRVRLDEDRNLAVSDDDGLEVLIELDERRLPVRLVERGDGEPTVRELLEWSTDPPLAYPRRIVQKDRGLEWRINSLEPLAEFDPLLLDAGK